MPLWPLGLYVVLVLLLMIVLVVLSAILGERHAGPATNDPFEGGPPVTGPARLRMHVNFYLVAMMFVIFDAEAVFLFAWAVSARTTGWPGYTSALVFILILGAALFYLWRLGALDWGTRSRFPLEAGRR